MSYYIGVPVTYTALASTAGFPTNQFSYLWEFGDGGTAYTASTQKIWSTLGPQTATVTATDSVSLGRASASKEITLTQLPEPTMPTHQWTAIKISKDSAVGISIARSSTTNDSIFRTINAGVTWEPVLGTPVFNQSSNSPMIAMSLDGSTMFTFDSTGYIFKSTNYGTTWTQLTSAGSKSWRGIACSGDGGIVYATIATAIYKSIDGGVTWAQISSINNGWTDIVTSSDGVYVVACGSPGKPYISNNGGISFAIKDLAATSGWFGAAVSPDGTIMIVGSDTGIYISNNNGSSFSITPAPDPSFNYRHIDCNFDATKILACNLNTAVFSNDGGTTWNSYTFASGFGIEDVSVDNTGNVFVVNTYNGYIYVSFDGGLSWLQR